MQRRHVSCADRWDESSSSSSSVRTISEENSTLASLYVSFEIVPSNMDSSNLRLRLFCSSRRASSRLVSFSELPCWAAYPSATIFWNDGRSWVPGLKRRTRARNSASICSPLSFTARQLRFRHQQ